MNPKIQKVTGEIEKIKAKIAGQQARLRELERQKTELENAEIVAIFRKERLTENDFAAFVRQMAAHSTEKQAEGFAPAAPFYQSEQEDIDNEK